MMRWVVDLTAASERSPGLNSWAAGVLKAMKAASEGDEWVVIGSSHLPESLRHAASALKGRCIIRRGHRGLLQQITLPSIARTTGADAILAASTVVPLRRHGVPVAAVIHDLRHLEEPERYGAIQRRYRHIMYRHAIMVADRLIAISHATARAVIALEPLAETRLTVAHPGADHVDEWLRPPRASHAIAFGQYANKEPRLAIAAWRHSMVSGDAVRVLHVIGVPAEERRHLQQFADSIGAAGMVCLHGALPADEYQRLFASAGLLLFPSSSEGLGIPVLEAMRLGVPVVASDIAPVREVAGDCVWYAPRDDELAFSRAIRAALAASAGQLEAARRHVAQLTWEACAAAIRQSLVMASGAHAHRCGL